MSMLAFPTIKQPTNASSASAGGEETVELFRLSVDSYHEMIEVGLLGPDDKLELLDGLLVKKMPNHPPHVIACLALNAALSKMLTDQLHIRLGMPITLSTSEPEPDLVIAIGKLRDFFKRHPGPSEIELAVEVSDSSLRRDQVLKMDLYAAAGISQYWIVNVNRRSVEVYRRPVAEALTHTYADATTFDEHSVVPVVLGSTHVGEFAVAELFE